VKKTIVGDQNGKKRKKCKVKLRSEMREKCDTGTRGKRREMQEQCGIGINVCMVKYEVKNELSIFILAIFYIRPCNCKWTCFN